MLRDTDGQMYVSPEVPDYIQEHLDEDTGDDFEAGRKRTYDVAALLNMTGALLLSIFGLVERADKSTASGLSLWNRLWPLLRLVLEKMDWL